MSVSVIGYSTNYNGEQLTLGNLVNNVPHSTLEQMYTGVNSDDRNNAITRITLKADNGFKFVEGTLKMI